ncbi:MAG: hypothetical protein AAGD14_19090, partial [Planctomycetota bacterium]
FSRAEVVIHYPGRTRIFTMWRAEWDGAAMPVPPGSPFFYRAAGEPWWDADRVMRANVDVVRGFVREEQASEPARRGLSEDRRMLRKVFRSQLPKGAEPRWWWGLEAFQAGGEEVRPTLEIEVGGVR